MPSIRFSIIVPTYNRAHIIGKTIRSVLDQTFPDWELIIVDDGSTDNTLAEVMRFPDPRIKYFWQENQERSAARNNGITKAQGEFICFLDSDDIWRRHHLETLNKSIADHENKPALYFTGMCWNFPDRKEDVIFEDLQDKNPVEYVIKNQIAPSTTSIEASILSKYQFNTDLAINEDVELFARITSQYPLVRIPEITVNFVIHSESTKSVKKDIVSAQMKAMEFIFNNSETRNKISPGFKKAVIKNLRHQLIGYYEQHRQWGRMNKEILRFLFLYPTEPKNKSKLVTLLYHLPGGSILKCLVAKLK